MNTRRRKKGKKEKYTLTAQLGPTSSKHIKQIISLNLFQEQLYNLFFFAVSLNVKMKLWNSFRHANFRLEFICSHRDRNAAGAHTLKKREFSP